MSPDNHPTYEGEVLSNNGSLIVNVTTDLGASYIIEYLKHPAECPLIPAGPEHSGDLLTVQSQSIRVSSRSLYLSIMVGNPIDPTRIVPVIHHGKCDKCGLNRCADPDSTPKCEAATPQRGICKQR